MGLKNIVDTVKDVGKDVIDSASSAMSNAISNTADVFSTKFHAIGNYVSNRRYPTISTDSEYAESLRSPIVSMDSLDIISALPPKYDNIVDPPVEISERDYQIKAKTLNSMGSGNKYVIGRAYMKNFLMDGNFVTFVPISLHLNPADYTAASVERNAFISSLSSSLSALKNTAGETKSPLSFWQTFNSILDIGGYGYTTKINGKAYWRHVAANMKVILYSLGIDLKNNSPMYAYYSKTMPGYIMNNMEDTEFLHRWGMNITNDEYVSNSGVLGSQMDPADKQRIEQLDTQIQTANDNISQIYQENAGAAAGGQEAVSTMQKKITEQNKLIDGYKQEKALVLSKYSNKDSVSANDAMQLGMDYNDMIDATSRKLIMKWVMATDGGSLNTTLPMVTFYVNGAIERNYGVSQQVGESEVASTLTGNWTQKLMNNLKNIGSQMFKDMGEAAANISKETAYTMGAFNFQLGQAYTPKVNKGADSDASFQVNIRSIADGSDPVSLAMHLYNLALLMPFYIEPIAKESKQVFIPKSPLLVSAFSKGVMNVPRGVISNIDIKSDPVFQTTESIMTDMEIGLTITPLISKGFSPSFDDFFSDSADGDNLILASFNPYSSFNILITLCGMNTTMTKINMSLWSYFFQRNLLSLPAKLLEGVDGFKSQLLDLKSTTIRNLSLGKAMRTF